MAASGRVWWRFLQEDARWNGLGEAGNDAVAVAGFDRAAGLDDQFAVPGVRR